MTGEAGAPGTAGQGYRVPEKTGRHRAPPPPPRPDRFTVPIAAAAAILTCASVIALTAPAVAPDGRVAGNGATVATAARTARTVHVPLTILPAPVPTIGGPGIWDPETDAPVENQLSRPVPSQNFAGAAGTVEVPEALSDELVATTAPSTTETPAPTAAATTTPSPTSTAAATTSSATPTEATVTATPTPEPTTDIGDLIDQIIEDAIGEGQ